MKHTPEELAQCARREAAMRKRVYPKWVETHKMSREKSKKEIEMMEEIANHFELLQRNQPTQKSLF